MFNNFKEHISGLTPVTKAKWLNDYHLSQKKILYITKDLPTAQTLQQDLLAFNPNLSINLFPDWDTLPFELASIDIKITAERILTLSKVINSNSHLIIAPIAGLIRKILPWELFKDLIFDLEVNKEVDRKKLNNNLIKAGFKKVSLVQEIGEMALRGNVIDLFPSTSLEPLRLEFNGDILSKIKIFDISSQLSHSTIEKIAILPVREISSINSIKYQNDLTILPKEIASKYDLPQREISKIVETIQNEQLVPGIEIYLQLINQEIQSLFDYLNTDTQVIFDDVLAIERNFQLLRDASTERHQTMIEQNILIPEVDHCFLNPKQLTKYQSKFNCIQIGHYNDIADPVSATNYAYTNLDELNQKIMVRNIGAKVFQPLTEYLVKWKKEAYKVCFVASQPNRQKRIQDLLNEINYKSEIVELSITDWLNNPIDAVQIIANLSAGFLDKSNKLVIITENELFSKKSRRATDSNASNLSLKQILSALDKLDVLDFIVHEDYGIGRFRGLAHLTIDGNEGDFLQLEYADSTLYLPAHNITKIKKYLGTEGVQPELDKLSAGKWTKTKAKVQQAVAEIAGELINLYAVREVTTGTAFETINQADLDFADQFAFNETPDQLQAIKATLEDMSKAKPMDRLICGDVGFGKTEVAIRAAYKCTQSAKQVAILAPTTILVEQHFQNFSERFKGYPIKVSALSRFRPNEENKKTIEELKSGIVDIVIGTHKLLQQNIEFKDLGLLIIDEEHRFGVKQKEKLKQLKQEIDVLTLTATPIPRTLHMALCQVRDISVITTAPPDRRVVQTHIAQRDENLIRSLLIREKQRAGQSFFIHNRVETLPTIIDGLKELCPELSFECAHGQMNERELEKIMQKFINKEIDVLVCTTIVESGLDIPNANTMIIDRADTFGLAQLYQLRGRVGRSSTQAYCYFLVPPLKKLKNEAFQRLEALKNLDDLGQGFQLALRDLEIRGAGNLLGREQSGNVLAVGYDLYTKILNEAILNVKSKSNIQLVAIDPDIKIGIQAFLPDFYIPDISERLLIYQRLASAETISEIENLSNEILDRFGGFDQVVQNLLDFSKLKIIAKSFLITRIEKVKDRLIIAFHNNAPINIEKVMQKVMKYPNEFKLTTSSALSLSWKEEYNNTERLVYILSEICNSWTDSSH